MEEERKEKGFIIKDKRLFDETGEVRQESQDVRTTEKPDASATKAASPPQGEERRAGEGEYFPEVNFANFILSLSTTVMYHFGDFPDPVTNEPVKNLQAAKHTIDTIGMLKNKTEGNLDENEKNLMDGLLFELRMRYVKETGPK